MSAALTFGTAGTNTTRLGNFQSITFQEASCLIRCPAPGFVTATGPFVPNSTVQMIANTPYLVQLDLLFNPEPTNVQVSGSIDPVFSASSGGQFVFSPGVVAPVPTPGAWLSMISGLLGLCMFARKRTTAAAMAFGV